MRAATFMHNMYSSTNLALAISLMNKSELTQAIADKAGLPKAVAGKAIDTIFNSIVAAVKKGDSVTISGFGTFKQHTRAARNGVNPATGAKIKIAASKLPKFTPGTTFKATVDPKAAARKAAGKAAGKPVAKAKK